MSIRKSLDDVLAVLPEERLGEVLDFAEFLAERAQDRQWQEAARARFAQAYGNDEPQYTEADVKADPKA